MQYKNGKIYDYYRCSRAVNRRDCDASQIERQWLEDEVLSSVPNEILDPEKIRLHQVEIDRNADAEAALAAAQRVELSRRITHVNRRIDNTTETLAELGNSPALAAKLKTLEGEKADLQAQLDQLAHPAETTPLSDEEIRNKAARFRELVEKRPETGEMLQRMLRGLLHRVSVEREGRVLRGLVTYYHPPETEEFRSTRECPHGGATHRHKFSYSFSCASK
jgi:predicted RNase H-like nuclease (RuvC/YqgF family)